jgi:hypothetical protein
MARRRQKTRLQKNKERESLRQAVTYLTLIFVLLYLMIKFGLPALIKMAGFIGSIRSSSEKIERQDTLPPLPPRIFPLPEATPSAQLDINGFAEPGATVQLYLRGISIKETVADNDGNFSFKKVNLRNGENEVYALARDSQGNKSQPSESWIVTVDNEAPKLNLTQPEDGQRFFDTDNPIIVAGLTEPRATLLINDRVLIIDDSGEFKTKLWLNEGDNQIEVVAKDAAGNETREALIVNYTP